MARGQAAQGPLREVLRWLERPAQGPGVLPRAVQQAWTALGRRLGRLRALCPEYAHFEPGGAPHRPAPLASLRRLSAALAGRVRTTLREEDKDRVREWREWLEESWSSDHRAVYRWLKDESCAPPVTFLTRPDGTATASLAEMDGLLQDLRRPINRKYATDPELEPLAFLRRYGHHVRRVPMLALRLDGPRLRKGLSRMKPSALGLDRWSLADLRSLPDRLLGWLADLLPAVEQTGKLPARLAEGYTALIPNEGPPGPLNTRPLTVLSMVHRLWAGVHLVDAIAWQEAWARLAAFRFRPARSALDGAAVTQVLLELCHLRGWAVAGISIDYNNGFDLILQAIVLALALELCMDPGTCRALGPMYKQLRQAFKAAGALGLWWQATNGIPQGCPLSVILVNVLSTIWKWEVDSLRRQVCAQTAALPPTLDEDTADDLDPGALPPLKDAGPSYAALGSSGYAQDTQAVALGAAALQDTVPTTEEWLRVTGQDVCVDKSWSCVQGERGAPAVLLWGVAIPLARTFRSSASTSPLGAPRSRDRCCPGAWRRDGAPCAAYPISVRMNGGSGPSAPWSPCCPSMGWRWHRRQSATCGGSKRRWYGPCGGRRACPGPRRSSTPCCPRGTACPR